MIRTGPSALALVASLALCPVAAQAQAPASPAAKARAASGGARLPLKHRPHKTTAAITQADLMSRIYLYADDSLLGRDAGSVGLMKATAYLAAEARRLGLRPAGENGTYFQNVPFVSRTLDSATTLRVEGGTLTAYRDFVTAVFRGALPTALDGVQVIYGGVVGDTALTAEQAKGKLVVLTPAEGRVLRILATHPLAGAAAVAIESGAELSEATMLLGRTPTLTLPPAPGAPSVRITMYVTTGAAERLLGSPSGGLAVGTIGRTVSGNLVFAQRPAPTRNVIATLRGSDPTRRGQYVAVGAHSDHVGFGKPLDHDSVLANNMVVRTQGLQDPVRVPTPDEAVRIRALRDSLARLPGGARVDSIFNGADDDGSGSMTVLELAEAFARGPVKPKRSLLFVWHTGEEKGLLGSRFFSDNATVPRDSIVAQINIDMVGRGGVGDIPGGGDRYLQLVGSRRLSTELGDLTEAVSLREPIPFTFDYQYDADGHADNIYCRSDHYNYARYGIPIVFITSGVHRDYHQVTDEPQYVNYPRLQRVARFAFNLTKAVAGLDHRPVVDKPKPDPNGICKQ